MDINPNGWIKFTKMRRFKIEVQIVATVANNLRNVNDWFKVLENHSIGLVLSRLIGSSYSYLHRADILRILYVCIVYCVRTKHVLVHKICGGRVLRFDLDTKWTFNNEMPFRFASCSCTRTDRTRFVNFSSQVNSFLNQWNISNAWAKQL